MLPDVPETFTPDSRFVHVANGYSDDASVVDIAAVEEVVRLPYQLRERHGVDYKLSYDA
jgi:hypothetical protein